MKKDKQTQKEKNILPTKQKPKSTSKNPEESKVMKYVLGIGTGVIIMMVVALALALIISSIIADRENSKEDPFKDVPALTLSQLNIMLPLQPSPSEENPNPEPVYPDIPELTVSNPKAYDQLIKQEYMILFYDGDNLTKELETLVLSFYERPHEHLGLVIFNLKNNQAVLTDQEGPLAALLKQEKNLEAPLIAKLNLENPSIPEFITDLALINQELAK